MRQLCFCIVVNNVMSDVTVQCQAYTFAALVSRIYQCMLRAIEQLSYLYNDALVGKYKVHIFTVCNLHTITYSI